MYGFASIRYSFAFTGVLYLVTGRNLVAPIVAHGLGNSIDFTAMYLGLYPGVGN